MTHLQKNKTIPEGKKLGQGYTESVTALVEEFCVRKIQALIAFFFFSNNQHYFVLLCEGHCDKCFT